MQKIRLSLLTVLVVGLFASTAVAQSFVTIPGSPLRINVGADGSFQVYNDSVPGVGQAYPTSSELADMGLFAHIDGVLHAPQFRGRPTATSSLGNYTSWTASSSSPLQGNGTASSPYTVAVNLAAPNSDVRATMTVTYVDGNNFFRVRSHFFATRLHEIDVTFGADIYLGGSDSGIFVSVPELNAVGGRNCNAEDGAYNILFIPATPANRFTASNFSDVWAQIGANDLSSEAEGEFCVDNGAAIQWLNVMPGPATSVAVSHAVSFGEIPSASNFQGFFINVDPDTFAMEPGKSAAFKLTSTVNEELGFNAPVQISVPETPPGITITFDDYTIEAPGEGAVNGTLTVDGSVFPTVYTLSVVATGGQETHGRGMTLEILCTPPLILGTSMPQTTTVARGASATLRVKPEGEGTFTYQWYSGFTGMTSTPMANGKTAEFRTPPVTEPTFYWVRVTNACGTADSVAALVIPQ